MGVSTDGILCYGVDLGEKGEVTKAARGYAEVIDPDAMSAVPYQLALPAAEMFCEEHGISFENPTWLLASMWW